MIQSQLNTLRDQISRKTQLEDLTAQWRGQLLELSQQTQTLHAEMLSEQNDVHKLEAGGIGTVIHKLTGRMEEKLDKERQEAQTASNAYQASASDLEQLQTKLTEAETELENLQDCQSQYIQLMLEQIQQLESMVENPENAGQLEVLKIQLQLQRRRKSLREALLESSEAARAAGKNLDYLKNLKESPELHFDKPENEDSLQKSEDLAHLLLEELTDLQAKLAQMGIDPEPHISVGQYLKAPTAYIAGRSSEFTQLDQINKAIVQLVDLNDQIAAIEDKLNQALSQVESLLTCS